MPALAATGFFRWALRFCVDRYQAPWGETPLRVLGGPYVFSLS